MNPGEPSRTALMIARQRAAHQVLDHGSILHDPFAVSILREDEQDLLQFASKHPQASIGRLFTAARSRIAEDAIAKAVERGVRQIVILGAGLDTFALRNPHGARDIRIYEVDHPATQAWKRQRLAGECRSSALARFRACRFRAGRFGREARTRRPAA
jgi:methyltransferase (TIGR00027 family)